MKSLYALRCACLASAISSLLFLSACSTRSISDSGYHRERIWKASPSAYLGELKESEVLGLDQGEPVTEEQILMARIARKRVRVHKGNSILLIQSGATYPDAAMISNLQKYYTVVPFSGVPNSTNVNSNFSKSIRLTAARGGCETVVCYWGILESAQDNLSSKSISWVPIVGTVVPDEVQHMRIRLKVALVDVETGSWTMFSPAAFEDTAISAELTRKRSDQKQVEKLKETAYETASADLVKTFSN